MQPKTFRIYSTLVQIGIWSLLFLIYFLEVLEYTELGLSFGYALSTVSIIAMASYLHYFFLLPLFASRRISYFVAAFCLISFFSTVIYWVAEFFYYDDPEPFWGSFIYNFFLLVIIVSMVSLNYFVEAWYQSWQRESLIENQRLQAELSFLKSQINPHFLFNTLNNIYSYVQTGNPKSAPMLEHLSSILRFMVYDCQEAKVELVKEVAAANSLLEIQKMKNSEQHNIQLEARGLKGFHLIAPLLIVNFVENACKHSDVTSNPNGFIRVNITVDEQDQFVLNISNSVGRKKFLTSKYQGVGLQNMYKRLELEYPDRYEINEDMREQEYHLSLKIPLTRKQ